MKKLSPFLAGMLTMAAVSSLGVSALAATGHMTITVDPINVQVNGEVFAPTDVNGNAVPVFAYNGTTYAPLRALAEAYGLEVGYDAESNMATVKDPDASTPAPDNTASAADYSNWSAEEEEAYQEFKGMWDLSLRQEDLQDPKDSEKMYLIVGTVSNTISIDDISKKWDSCGVTWQARFSKRITHEFLNSLNKKDSYFVRLEIGASWVATVSGSYKETDLINLHQTTDTPSTPPTDVRI